MKHNPLGEETEYKFNYDPSLLYPIPRVLSREVMGIDGSEFKGVDIWNAYELSWLNINGKPETRILKLVYSSDSPYIVESKSFKLYLNSYIMTPFKNEDMVKEQIERDLSTLLKPSYLKVTLNNYDSKAYNLTPIPSELLLDNLDINDPVYTPSADVLEKGVESSEIVERYSNLFKSNCPVTGQPDWATVYIKYKAKHTIDDISLLKYLISYRDHSGYHESCCEHIFMDIKKVLNPELLTVKCFFTRRGGIDINPIRSLGEDPTMEDFHYFRQ